MSVGPRPLADAAEAALVRLDKEFRRRALGARPWTVSDYYERVERLTAQYTICREGQRRRQKAAAS
jgi:rhodanese-related sulfurtransferase